MVTETEDIEALGIQQRYVDMAAKIKGIYAAEKRDITVETYEERVKRLLEGDK